MSATFVEECLAVLSRTPGTLDALLRDLPDEWTRATEGPGTWCPYDVIGHLIHGEHSDWMPRIHRILENGTGKVFDKVDREAQFRESAGKSLPQLLDEFQRLREQSLADLRSLRLTPAQFDLEGTHPTLGTVTLRNLLATWTTHDLAHLVQVSRVMAKRYRDEIGPFASFLSVMK